MPITETCYSKPEFNVLRHNSVTKKRFQRRKDIYKGREMFKVFRKILFITVLLIGTVISNPAHDDCREPTPSELRSLLADDTHESFDMSRYEHFRVPNDINYFKNARITAISGPRECRRTRYSPHINTASSCPWHYVMNNDPNRKPEHIIEAKCNCRNRPCIDGMESSRCHPVKYNIRVLRKYGCENGTFLYQKTMERITVGCTCVLGQ